MTEIKYKIYRPISKKELGFIRKGTCIAYVPDVKDMDEHVTIDLGDTQIMLDKKAFKEFCKEVIGMPFKTSITKLKLVKG